MLAHTCNGLVRTLGLVKNTRTTAVDLRLLGKELWSGSAR